MLFCQGWFTHISSKTYSVSCNLIGQFTEVTHHFVNVVLSRLVHTYDAKHKRKYKHKEKDVWTGMTQSTRASTLVLVSSRFKRIFSCAYAYACVVRLNQPSMLFFFSCLNALRACVYIYIQLLSYFRAPTLWFIDVTIATCHVRYTFLSLCQFCSRENGQNTKILRMIRKLPPTVTRRAKH